MGSSREVQGLGLLTQTAESVGSVPGRGTKVPYASGCVQKLKKKKLETMQYPFQSKNSPPGVTKLGTSAKEKM